MGTKRILHLVVMVIALTCAFAIVCGGMTVYSETLNKMVFGKKSIVTEKEKIQILKTLALWLSLYLFGLAVAIMSLRVLTGKGTPASGNDPVYIGTLNRILSNTIQQSIIFAGLYVTFLYDGVDYFSRIGGAKILALASLFVVGRVLFAVGYLLGALTRISTFRSLGFAINLMVNLILVSHHLDFEPFTYLNIHVAPIVKSFVA